MSLQVKLQKHRRKRNFVINLSVLLGGIAAYYGILALWVGAFSLLNTYGWVLFFLDKRKATLNQKFRIPESTFFLVSLCGGGLGTYVGMLLHRHKTKHRKFRIGLFLLLVTSTCIFIFGLLYIGLKEVTM